MAVVQRRRKVQDVLCRSELAKSALARELLVQLALRRELQDEVDALDVVEVRVEAKDVRMPQVGLDFDLAPKLVLYATLHEPAIA